MDKLEEANKICKHSPIRVGWAMRETGEHEVILGFDRPMNGIGISLKDAEKFIETLQKVLQQAKNHNEKSVNN